MRWFVGHALVGILAAVPVLLLAVWALVFAVAILLFAFVLLPLAFLAGPAYLVGRASGVIPAPPQPEGEG